MAFLLKKRRFGQQISVDVTVDYDIEHRVKDDDLTTTISLCGCDDAIEIM
jgi:dihydroneopterin aldolase